MEWTTRINDDQMVLSVPISIGSAVSVLGIMRRSSAFSPEVKEWLDSAKGDFIYSYLDMQKFRNVMRQWWREINVPFRRMSFSTARPMVTIGRSMRSSLRVPSSTTMTFIS